MQKQFIATLALIRAWLVRSDEDPEAGHETIQTVLLAVAAIAIVAIVVAAITGYVQAQSDLIQ
jgi:hypothetical protein